MSAAAAPARAPGLRGSGRPLAAMGAPTLLGLLAFAALGAFATAHWARLVEDPPAAGLAAAVLVTTCMAAGLRGIGRLPLSRKAVHGLAVAATVAGTALALVAAGLPAELLQPARWDDLADEVDRGLAGIRTVGWPYAGPDGSVRLMIVLGAPLLLAAAAALAFWPLLRRAAIPRAVGLVALLVLYGLPVTEYDPGRPILRGVVLLGLLAAWLWVPRLGRSEAIPAAAVLVAVAVLSLPVANRLDSETALVNYHAWDWLGGKDVTFDWNHSYGPLDWPREGTTLLNVRARRPHFWKAQTLDQFDGLRWQRSRDNERTRPLAELPSRPDRRWDERIRVVVRALRTDFVVTAGTPYLVNGAGEAVSGSADGTVRRLEEPLRRGDSYTVRTYAPHPNAREMRAVDDLYTGGFAQYTTLALPARGVDALNPPPRDLPTAGLRVEVPLWGAAGDGLLAARRALAASRYGKTFRLAQRLAAGAPGVYEAVSRIERHLRRNYSYNERTPSHRYPLESFLFEDRSGYCQQFSGAMALMLRMIGIPARVVSGFSPGSFNKDSGEYRVRDLDAHSWVEVYFSEIGWVTFDPTPAAAPADRPGGAADSARGLGDSAGAISAGDGASPGGDRPGGFTGGASSGDGGGVPLAALVAMLGLALAGVAVILRRRRRPPTGPAATEASLEELRRALVRLGWDLTPATTLLQLERRLAGAAGPRTASYVSWLRAGRFARGDARPPGRTERRELRRELTAGRGLRLRLRGFLALPPGSPFSGS